MAARKQAAGGLTFEQKMKLREARFKDHLEGWCGAPAPLQEDKTRAQVQPGAQAGQLGRGSVKSEHRTKREREPFLPGETRGARMRRVLLSGANMRPSKLAKTVSVKVPKVGNGKTATSNESLGRRSRQLLGVKCDAPAATVDAGSINGLTPSPEALEPARQCVDEVVSDEPAPGEEVNGAEDVNKNPAVLKPVPTRVGKDEYKAQGFVSKSITMKVTIGVT